MAVAVTAIPAAAATRTTAGDVAGCAPAGELNFICGTGPVEDIVHVPGTRWLIGGALNVGTPARLRLIDTNARRVQDAAVTLAATAPRGSPCPGAPDMMRWSMSGLALAPNGRGRFRLFAANHGDRHAIEMFDVVTTRGAPEIRWSDCAPMPAGTLANAVTASSAGEVFVASFYAREDARAWERLARAEPTGSVWRWRIGQGFTRVDTGPLSGGNGIALSPDRRRLYVSAWAERAILVLDRATGTRRRIALDYLPDNIHVGADGTLIVGGQRTTVAAIAACGAQCPQPWVVERVHAATGKRTVLASGPGTTGVNYACGALDVADTLYITVRGDDRIAYRHLPAAPSTARQPATSVRARSAR